MVLDAAKGIEDQTLKLFEVCRSRGIPIITFINKCDRPGKEPLELLEGAANPFNMGDYLKASQTPVFFGSAINNFGVQLLLDGFLRHSSTPLARESAGQSIPPTHDAFSAFVFKIQANMDPNHRDRLTFLRVCSGRFHRDLRVRHAQSGRTLRLSHSHQMFGRDRDTADEAWPGDILGLTGQSDLEIGDTLTEDLDIAYDAIPRFAPECFIYLHGTDTRQFKKFRKGLQQLLQEKVVQQFFPLNSVSQVPLLGAVGRLQFDVVSYRLESEYGAITRMENAPWTLTRWIEGADEDHPALSGYLSGAALARDDQNRLCIFFETQWNLDYFSREHPEVKLRQTPPTLN
jgi:peptide chain release factor 3